MSRGDEKGPQVQGRDDLSGVRRLVVKIGSQMLSTDDGRPDFSRIEELAQQVSAIRKRGVSVLVITSGAIAFGREALKWDEKPRTTKESQMLASVGQAHLIQAYRQAFEVEGMIIGQVLLTHRELADRTAYINAHHTLMAMLEHDVVPVLNENDAVGYEEICFGDNDQLAALVSAMVEADLLTILTYTDGVFTADPSLDADAVRVSEIDGSTAAPVNLKGSSKMGSGGMQSKVSSAQVACEAGISVVVTNQSLLSVLDGADVGTFFRPAKIALEKRRHWLRHGLKEKGTLYLDEGASKALESKGASILPVGVTAVEGAFQRGDVVAICGIQGKKIARGLAEYPSAEMKKILGKHSNEIEGILGYRYLDVVVHRDDLVLE